MASDTFVIVTARNEARWIGATLDGLAVAFPGAQVWVADDGSTDATSELAQEAGARVVRSNRVIGKGGAATAAAHQALQDTGAVDRDRDQSIFVCCDADLGESASLLDPLADAIRGGEADLAIAVFATRAGGGFGLALTFARWAVHRRCGLSTRAPISGQRALRADVLPDVLPFAPGFGMEVGMTIDAVRAGHRVVEIDLDLAHRATGRSPAGFAHRARQLVDFVRVYLARA
jgi:glycosyltransferase involved in cell wall biosynthesis